MTHVSKGARGNGTSLRTIDSDDSPASPVNTRYKTSISLRHHGNSYESYFTASHSINVWKTITTFFFSTIWIRNCSHYFVGTSCILFCVNKKFDDDYIHTKFAKITHFKQPDMMMFVKHLQTIYDVLTGWKQMEMKVISFYVIQCNSLYRLIFIILEH